LIQLDCEHDVQMKRAEYAERLSKQWMTVLTDVVANPLAGGAAIMTEKEFAEVVEKIVAERKSAAEKLEKLLEEKVRDGDAFERMEHFETLRKRLELDADRIFAGKATPTADNGAGAARDT
jgi:hypothetical protein